MEEWMAHSTVEQEDTGANPSRSFNDKHPRKRHYWGFSMLFQHYYKAFAFCICILQCTVREKYGLHKKYPSLKLSKIRFYMYKGHFGAKIKIPYVAS